MRWKTFSNPTLPPSTSPTSLYPPLPPRSANSNDNRTPIDDSNNPESYALLCSQLRSAAEKRAAQLSKGVMNDLERRLLQRQNSGWFETFLVAMVLLNCVERTSWLFWTWEDEQYYSKVPDTDIFLSLKFCTSVMTKTPPVAARSTTALLSPPGRGVFQHASHAPKDARTAA